MPAVSGPLYTPEGFQPRTVTFADGVVESIARGAERGVLSRGLILPLFVNAHTHLGDVVVTEEPQGTLEEVVAPPHGLKFRRLAEVSPKTLQEALRHLLTRMVATGTGGFSDFREGGVAGAIALREALRGTGLAGRILGRPTGLTYDAQEVRALLEIVDGIAVSGLAEWEYDALGRLSQHVHSLRKPFALHGSEASREDVDALLDLDPAFLVHMTAATEADWARCADAGVPVVVCPRSQLFFQRVPDLPGMLAAGLDLSLGTDNAMIAGPSMLQELATAYRCARLHGGVPPAALLDMAVRGTNLLSEPPSRVLHHGGPSNLLVLDVPTSGDSAFQVIKASDADIALLSLGSRLWQRERGWVSEALHG